MKQPVHINEAEAVFESFHDSLRSGLAHWSFSCAAGSGGSCEQEWQGAKLTWKQGGRVVASLARKLELDISLYSHFMMRCNLPETCRMTVNAVVDGKRRRAIRAVQGQNVYYDFEGPLTGKRLEWLEMEIASEADGPGAMSLFWLGLFDARRRAFMRARPSPYDDKWEGLILPEQDIAALRPALGLFLDGKELSAIRRKVKRSYYRTVMGQLRRSARGHLDSEPHRRVGEYPAFPSSGQRYDRTCQATIPQSERIQGQAMRVCAFVGLVDEDPVLLRVALSHALAAAHCTYWDDSHMMALPGGCWDHRAFTAAGLVGGVVAAWDWAGSLLTDAGHALLARSVSLKALPLLHMSLEKYGYMRHCNQGIIFAAASVLAHAALAKVWEHGGERFDSALAALTETVRNYTEPDGGAHEGLAYFNWSFNTALEGYLVAARHKGKPVGQVAPACLLKTPDYLRNILSTIAPAGNGINVADGGRPAGGPTMDMLTRLLAVTDDAEVRSLWAAVRRVHEGRAACGGIDDVLHGPARLPKAKAAPPVFSLLKHTGMLCSNRPVRGGTVRLQLIGAKAGAGHTHEDKGSFVLEAYGEEILIDRGICAYADTRALGMKRADQHNMLTPAEEDARIDACDGALKPVYHLTLRAPASRAFTLRTTLTVARVASRGGDSE